MGREIRRVPKGWEHPKDGRGHYIPLFDGSYQEEAEKWVAQAAAYHARDSVAYRAAGGWFPKDDTPPWETYPWFWQWADNPPNSDHYRPEFTEPADHYQIYETVSEGTPVSPVFATKGEMAEWLVSEGYSEDAAAGFCESGWAPSFAICGTSKGNVMVNNIEMHGVKCSERKDDEQP